MIEKKATGPDRANDRPRQDHTFHQGKEIVAQIQPSAKEFSTVQVKFALFGHELTRSVRAGDGRVTWFVSRWGYSRALGHWQDVLALLTQVGGKAAPDA